MGPNKCEGLEYSNDGMQKFELLVIVFHCRRQQVARSRIAA